jgi:hypothetical protein
VSSNAIALLDGTHCEIKKPAENQKAFYSGYKNIHSQNYLVVVNPFALVIYVDGPYPGRMNDRACWNQSPLAISPSAFLSEGELIIADGGFIGGEGLLCPVDAMTIGRLESKEEQQRLLSFNDEITEARVLVEDVFSWLKARARILGTRFPRKREMQSDVFVATCCLYNFVRLKRIEFSNEWRNGST